MSSALLLCPALVLVTGAASPPHGEHVDLYQDGVALAPTGALLRLPADGGARYLPGSRVLDPAGLDAAALRADGVDAADGERDRLVVVAGPGATADDLLDPTAAQEAAAASRAWLAAGTVPGAGTTFAGLGEAALLDLHAMTLANGASLAAPSPPWRYVWPRDASFAAVAYARTGHRAEAVAALRFLASVQEDDGSFHARYLPDGSGVPDARGTQSDGGGWALWAAGVVLDAAPDDERAALAAELAPLVDACTDHLVGLVTRPDHLPPPSPDYWEQRTDVLTLGTAAPVLAGLESAAEIHRRSGDLPRAAAAFGAANRLRDAVETTFGTQGYPRAATGGARDAAAAFVLPPFQPTPLDGALDAWHASADEMFRPAGGLAPGGGWKSDGISWTPQTALYALTAATNGDRATAERWLRWIDHHRTASGAIPEKVLADGSPAAVAPLTWSSALVVLTLVALDDADAP